MLNDVLNEGKLVDRKKGRSFIELISYQFKIDDPRDRLIFNKNFGLNIFQCVGQFLWITQGSHDAEAMEYYAPYSKRFSTDQIRMIGAYGPRLFGIHHLNQIQYVIDTLDEDEAKRRAVASIYLPQFDQHKFTDEVPCTLNLQYLVREKKVHEITYMRSQNAYRLLPLDVFLFTMLQEYVNAVLTTGHDTTLGNYNHHSGSFHVYIEEIPQIKNALEDNTNYSAKMESMPSRNIKLRIPRLNKFESLVRTTISAHEMRKKPVNFDFLFETLEDWFKEKYWKQLALLLVCYGTIIMKDDKNLQQATKMLDPIYQYFVQLYLDRSKTA